MSKEFAVININKSNQYIVQKDDVFKVDRLPSDSSLEVLLYANEENVEVGQPVLSDFGVRIEVIEDKLDKKISVRRFRNKSRYRRNNGHRQPVSIIKVLDLGKKVKSEVLRKSK